MRKLFFVGLFTFFTAISNGQIRLSGSLPVAKIKVDGNFSDTGWIEAHRSIISDSVELFMTSDTAFIYIGIRCKGKSAMYTDMYIDDGINLFNFHASFQIGERLLTDTSWNDQKPEWQFGNQRGWIASYVRLKDKQFNDKLSVKEQVQPYEGYEFKIRKRKFSASSVKLMIEIKGFEEGPVMVAIPQKTVRKNTSQWLQFKW